MSANPGPAKERRWTGGGVRQGDGPGPSRRGLGWGEGTPGAGPQGEIAAAAASSSAPRSMGPSRRRLWHSCWRHHSRFELQVRVRADQDAWRRLPIRTHPNPGVFLGVVGGSGSPPGSGSPRPANLGADPGRVLGVRFLGVALQLDASGRLLSQTPGVSAV